MVEKTIVKETFAVFDAEGWNERGNEFSIRVTELMYLHTIIHEFAHIVNFVQDGWSGHGNRFREVYEELLRKYGGKMNANVSVPRI